MPEHYDLNFIQGSAWSGRLIAKNADGTPIDLTNFETRGAIKQEYSDISGLTHLYPAPVEGDKDNGYVDIIVEASGTAVLPVTQAVYDVEMHGPTGVGGVSSNDIVVKIFDGNVNIQPPAVFHEHHHHSVHHHH